jgi:hypothetical protein
LQKKTNKILNRGARRKNPQRRGAIRSIRWQRRHRRASRRAQLFLQTGVSIGEQGGCRNDKKNATCSAGIGNCADVGNSVQGPCWSRNRRARWPGFCTSRIWICCCRSASLLRASLRLRAWVCLSGEELLRWLLPRRSLVSASICISRLFRPSLLQAVTTLLRRKVFRSPSEKLAGGLSLWRHSKTARSYDACLARHTPSGLY